MKILVIDDNRLHLDAAVAQLSGHEVTTVQTYDEAQRLLSGPMMLGRPTKNRHNYDVVLVDLLMPASKQRMHPRSKHLAGQEMPVGIFLALLAAKNGAKHVALLTDINHHFHPASACLDAFGDVVFTVERAKLLLSNDPILVYRYHRNNLAKAFDPGDYIGKKQPRTVLAKNWRLLLRKVMQG